MSLEEYQKTKGQGYAQYAESQHLLSKINLRLRENKERKKKTNISPSHSNIQVPNANQVRDIYQSKPGISYYN